MGRGFGQVSQDRGAVELENVTKRYGSVVAVDHLSLSIRSGEFLSLLGPSGCGKTTTLRMLAGFEQPDEGFIRISGQYVQGIPPYKRDVNTVFQHYALFPHMTVSENVAYGLRQKGVNKSEMATRVAEALDMVQMSKLADRKPRQMSGGQQQRVAVARALVNRPSVLLLDEPLGALDRKLREEMQIELKLLQSRLGITFVFVTHDQEEAMSMSDRIAIMLDGHIEQLGDPETVYEHPASAFVAGFIGRNNFWSGVATEHGARADDGTEFVASRPEEDVPNGQGALAAVRPECINLSVERPSSTNNAFQGTVAGVSHFGDVLQYVVHAADRDVLVLTPRANASRLHAGDSVWASWSADDVYLFSSRQADIVMAEADEVEDE
ncbi:MAG: spermidine/putrescine ABC transporter ATP-binding protein [Acidimicrobiales bacterium mtb01]|nr:ABC transporter ATP-binding protein [Actinomycetota bacterium]TEX44871.1 MAG: spermidine/putrescine ABC transporter ATP-binding protein [Acidimicrobiales bacterium mtb01]